jgi:hypothetical protein
MGWEKLGKKPSTSSWSKSIILSAKKKSKTALIKKHREQEHVVRNGNGQRLEELALRVSRFAYHHGEIMTVEGI